MLFEYVAQIIVYCEGEEIDDRVFGDREEAEEFFDTYPLDDMADKIVLFGFDQWGDWDEIDSREACPSP